MASNQGNLYLKKELEKKTQELEMVYAKLATAERLAGLGKMASAVAHELRNPMGVIRLAVYSLKKKVDSKDKRLTRHLENIDKKIIESDQIIHDLLAFSRASEMEFKSIHINESLERGLAAIEQQFREKNVTIIKNLEPKMPKITADCNQLIEVFHNLFLNALQAMKESESRELKVSSCYYNGSIEVEIKDTGCGISPENLEKLGKPFFSTKTKGIGLGLYIAYEIIRRHKGTIEAQSEFNQGTTFIIKLPLNYESFANRR